MSTITVVLSVGVGATFQIFKSVSLSVENDFDIAGSTETFFILRRKYYPHVSQPTDMTEWPLGAVE